jgi:hypothetical protein
MSMGTISHFIFELIKIGILSAVYGTIIFLILRLIKKDSIQGLKQLWRRSFATVYIVLFVFMFTYWGDHGMGNDSNIPIPHYNLLINPMKQLISKKKGNEIEIWKLSYDDWHLFAE